MIEKNILLISECPKIKSNYVNSLPPIGILTLASFLESKGAKVDVIDYNVEKRKPVNYKKYDLIGFSAYCSNIENTLKQAKWIKETTNAAIIVGGPHCMANPLLYIKKPFIDAAIIGEAEYTLYEYLTKKDKSEIKGLYIRKDNKPFFTGNREYIKDLDQLPFPALEKVDIKHYNVPLKKAKPISNIMTSRGCPFQCIFCFHSLGTQFRARSPKNVVDEIEWQINKFGVKEICIFDDNFALDAKRAEKIADLIIERGLKIKLQFTNGIRVDNITKELLFKLKKAGIWLVGVAPESGNQDSLIKMKKGVSLDKIKQVVKWCKELGIITHSYFMMGFPWETKQHLINTINFAEKLDTDITQFTRVMPFPGTELYKMMELKLDTESKNDQGLFYGSIQHKVANLTEKEVHKYIKIGYRKTFIKPKKIFKLLITLNLVDFFKLCLYAITSESV
jgi:radical SAM superfamily enzyme YgiQ (UPF0313 family)